MPFGCRSRRLPLRKEFYRQVERPMTKRQNNDAKARAEAVFRKPAETAPTASGNEETSVSADNEPISSISAGGDD